MNTQFMSFGSGSDRRVDTPSTIDCAEPHRNIAPPSGETLCQHNLDAVVSKLHAELLTLRASLLSRLGAIFLALGLVFSLSGGSPAGGGSPAPPELVPEASLASAAAPALHLKALCNRNL